MSYRLPELGRGMARRPSRTSERERGPCVRIHYDDVWLQISCTDDRLHVRRRIEGILRPSFRFGYDDLDALESALRRAHVDNLKCVRSILTKTGELIDVAGGLDSVRMRRRATDGQTKSRARLEGPALAGLARAIEDLRRRANESPRPSAA